MSKEIKRIAVFVIYDKNGIVDRSVDYYLSQLRPLLARLVIVVNGILSKTGEAILKNYTSEIIVRKNTGYDTEAFKCGIQTIGYETLKEYDELLILNDSVFGPIYPLEDMFSKMEKRTELSFWGVSGSICHNDNTINHYIEGYFTVFNNDILCSEYFKDYWENLPEINNRDDAVKKHETIIARFFETHGFKWNCYVPIEDLHHNDFCHNTTYEFPIYICKIYKCPFIKKNLFSIDNKTYILCNDIYNFIKKDTNYDISFVEDVCKKKISGSDCAAALDLLTFEKKERIAKIAISTLYAKYRLKKKLLNNTVFFKIWQQFRKIKPRRGE